MILLPMLASAHDIEVKNADGVTIYYKYINNGTELAVTYRGTNCYTKEYTGNVVIPEEVTYMGSTRKVTSIGNHAFYSCSSLTSVTIPNSVTSIGGYAFYQCSSLTSITIPNSVPSIGQYAFFSCHSLTSVTIPNRVTSIGAGAFASCNGLTSVTIPNSVTSIENYAFRNCSGLTSVTIGNNVTSIGDEAFKDCSGLTSVTIPNSVMSIGKYAFQYCSGLISVAIGNCVTSIGKKAFESCLHLTSVTIGYSVITIGAGAFASCSGLTSITIPNSVTSIDSYAFYECTGLTSIVIGSGIEGIGDKAFASCPNLTDVYCYAINVPFTSSFAFQDSHITNATLHVPDESIIAFKNNSYWKYFKKIVVLTDSDPKPDAIKSGTCGDHLIWNYYESTHSLVIAGYGKMHDYDYGWDGNTSRVTTPWSTFCNEILSVTLSERSDNIGKYAFCSCTGLTSVTIPNNVMRIGERAFRDCSSLTSVTIPNSVTSINEYAFLNCSSLTSVVIGSGIKNLYSLAFASCSQLTDVYCHAINIPNTNLNAFNGSYTEYATLHVPAESIDAYKSTAPWKNFKEIVALTDSDPKPDVTGVNVVRNTEDNKAVIYDLNGVRLSEPKKGINIINGKKYVRK